MTDKNILVADDQQEVCDLIKQMLEIEGYTIFQAYNGKEALGFVQNFPIDVAILDIKMPVMDGIETLKKIKQMDTSIEVLIATGYSDLKTLKQTVGDFGAFDYLSKPFNRDELTHVVHNAFLKRDFNLRKNRTDLKGRIAQLEKDFIKKNRELRETQIKYKNIIEENADSIIIVTKDGIVRFVNSAGESLFDKKRERLIGESFGFPLMAGETTEIEIISKNGNVRTVEAQLSETEWEGEIAYLASLRDVTDRKQMEAQLQQSLSSIRKSMEGTIQVVSMIVEKRDPYTAGHQQRVAGLARAIAEEMKLSKDRIEGIYMSGVIHDVGKVSVPTEILSKPGKITAIEFELIKNHAQEGYKILEKIEFPWPVAKTVHQHHENIDGSGYPLGLSGNEILLEARIMCVADVVEAMASHRPYRPALGVDVALKEISHKKGILYDPEVVDACLTLFIEKRFQLE